MAPVIKATPGQIAAAQAALPAYDAWLAPGQPSKILFEVRMLLNSFPERDMNQQYREALMERWTRDLDDLPLHAIAAACSELRRSKTEYSPLCGEIRVAAMNIIRDASDERFKLQRLIAVGRPIAEVEESTEEKEFMSARLWAVALLVKGRIPKSIAEVDELAHALMAARQEARHRLTLTGKPIDEECVNKLALAIAMPEEDTN